MVDAAKVIIFVTTDGTDLFSQMATDHLRKSVQQSV